MEEKKLKKLKGPMQVRFCIRIENPQWGIQIKDDKTNWTILTSGNYHYGYNSVRWASLKDAYQYTIKLNLLPEGMELEDLERVVG